VGIPKRLMHVLKLMVPGEMEVTETIMAQHLILGAKVGHGQMGQLLIWEINEIERMA
jgi:hypothetical protein